jgi:Tol biopolymer transport system component
MKTHKLPLVLLLMMVIVSAGCLIQLQSVSATFPGKNGKIVFVRYLPPPGSTSYQDQIFTVNPDGSGLAQLTNTGANRLPRWSADGTKIVFVSDRITTADADGNAEIWIMNADGSGQTQLTFTPSTVDNDYPALSPDGSKIVFSRTSGGLSNIWVMNADGSNQQQLTNAGKDSFPVWSPDGLKIAFASTRTGEYEIFVMNSDGLGQTDISNNPGAFDFFPEWSPDGTRIAFARYQIQQGVEAIWVMNADGSGQKQLSNPPNPLADLCPAWSPDGTKIAFARGIDSIWVMNADGSNPVDITQSQPNSATDTQSNWQPLSMNPVGGVVLPTNTLAILAPYLALAGLVIAVSAVVVAKKRRD